MEKFSIIIPTMWKSPLIYNMLKLYVECTFVEEIIIINNGGTPVWALIIRSPKIRIAHMTKNSYVNAAWNLGANYARATVILANDDIDISYSRLYSILFAVSIRNDYDLVGATINNLSENKTALTTWDKSKGFPRKSFGCFMVCRKYVPIPEEMKILCGDNWLFDHAATVGIIGAGYIDTPISVTIKSDPEFTEIGKRDKEIYKRIKTTPNP